MTPGDPIRVGDELGWLVGVSGARVVFRTEQDPSFRSVRCDLVTHANEIFFSEEEIKKSARRFK